MKSRALMIKFISIILTATLLAGCGEQSVAPVKVESSMHENGTTRASMLETPEVTYEVPQMFSSILVDRLGYDLNDKKQAVIVADMLPASFALYDATTGEAVYKGLVKKSVCTEDGDTYTGICDFSDYETEGEYYISAEIVGVSENFFITDNMYEVRMKEAYTNFLKNVCNCDDTSVSLENSAETALDVSGGYHTDAAGSKNVVDGCIAIMDMLTAYELNKKGYSDNIGIQESGNSIPDIIDLVIRETDWLLKMQNSSTGGVYAYVSTNQDGQKIIVGESANSTAHFCAAMAKCATVIKPFDAKYAKNCSSAASKAWKCLEANKSLVPEDQLFRAAVEMYKLTGYTAYSTLIINYLMANADKEYEGRTVLDGAITYLATNKYTDLAACNALMANFMSRTEDKATSASHSRYFVESALMTPEELLRNAYELTLVDYVISSTEYTKLEKNYLHYLGGRNEKSVIYFNNITGLDAYAELIVLTSTLNKKK